MGSQKSSSCVAVASSVTQKVVGPALRSAQRVVGVIGSRSLPLEWADRVGTVTEDLLGRGCNIASGGAVGTDEFVLSHLVHIGESARGTLYSPWSTYEGFPVKVRSLTRQFKDFGGSIVWGTVRGTLISVSFCRRKCLRRD